MKRLFSFLLAFMLSLTLVETSSFAASEQISLDKCKVSFSKKEYAYTGNGLIPVPKVTYKRKKLKKDTDYTIYYKDNVNVGTATATLVGMGKYNGSAAASFTIVKGKQKIKAKNIKATYRDTPVGIGADSASKLSYKSSNKKVATVNDMGEVTFKNAGKAKITITAEETSNLRSAKKVISVTVVKAKSTVVAFGGKIKKGEKWNLHSESSSGGKLSYSSSNKKIATVSQKGIVKGVKKGTVTITVKCASTKNYKSAKTKVKIKVE